MKKTILSLVATLMSLTAFAGQSIDLECRIFSSATSLVQNITIKSGAVQKIKCDSFSCPDSDNWDITMLYNGNGNEDLGLEVTDRISGQSNSVQFSDLKKESMIIYSTYNKKKNTQLAVHCEVRSIK